jgi:hypothetical protein
VLAIKIDYQVRAKAAAGWGSYRFTEVVLVLVEEATGRIAAERGTVWRTLREEARDRLVVDRLLPNAP